MSRKFRTMVYVLLLGRSVSFINFLWFSPFLIVLKSLKKKLYFLQDTSCLRILLAYFDLTRELSTYIDTSFIDLISL